MFEYQNLKKLDILAYPSVISRSMYAGKRKDRGKMNQTIPRMWTIAQVVAYLKEQDPNTKITDYRVRLWCKQGRIPYVCTGKGTKLINIDRMGEYINHIAEEDNRQLLEQLAQAENLING